tara:strand:+ start:175 stop:360 length:186 start_codon:yes stop_codon:yes gene_type:complete
MQVVVVVVNKQLRLVAKVAVEMVKAAEEPELVKLELLIKVVAEEEHTLSQETMVVVQAALV